MHRLKGRGLICILGVVLVAAALTGCSIVNTLLQPTPTLLIIPSVTATPSPTASMTPSLTPTRIHSALAGTPVPQGQPITAANAAELKVFAQQGGGIPMAMNLSKDGKWVAAASTRGIFIYEASSFREIYRMEMPVPQQALAFSEDSLFLASAGQDGVISLWQIEDGRLLRQFKPKIYSYVVKLIFSPDGQRLISADTSMVTRVWRVSDGTEQRQIRENARIIQNLQFVGQDNNLLYTWAPKEPIRVWNLDSGQKKREIFIGQDEQGNYAVNGSFSADGAYFAANSGMRVRIYRMSNGTTRQLIRLSEPARYVLLSQDGSQMVAVGKQKVFLYTLESKSDPMVLEALEPLPQPDKAALVSGDLTLWTLTDGLARWKMDQNSQPEKGLANFASAYALDTVFLKKNGLRANIMLDGTVHFLNKTGVIEQSIYLDDKNLNAAAISADGEWIVTSGKDKKLSLWSSEGKLQKTLSSILANSLSLSDSGLLASAGVDASISLWDILTAKQTEKISVGDIPQQVQLSQDAKFLAARTRGEVLFWDLSQVSSVKRFKGDGMALSADGQLLAVSVSEPLGHSIKIYQMPAGTEVTRMDARGPWMGFSPDNQLFVVGGDSLSVWDVQSGQLLNLLPGEGLVGRAVFNSDDHWLALVGWDETFRIWGVP